MSPLTEPPTDVGASFTIEDLGTSNGGQAITAIRPAFEDCWGEKTLSVQGRFYSFRGDKPIYCCHIPEENWKPEEHGPQTIGLRYSYDFMSQIEDGPIQVVAWHDTRFPDVEHVIYP